MLMKYVIKKIITLFLALFLISVIVFFAFSVLPADAAVAKLGTDATPERLEALREAMGLNKSVFERYGIWLVGALQGDFGNSPQYTNKTVTSRIRTRLGN